jgi:cellulose synthase/poly-beta-1,6-N-acetylglucosamine synthase-like glycosyltransferase
MFPAVHLGLALVVLVASFLIHGSQLIISRFQKQNRYQIRISNKNSFVSVFVPTHNEPPEILAETLRSLSRLDWQDYEVLVIDNNTSDAAIWRPIETLCHELGPRFRFFHIEGLRGAKAGAINWASKHINPKSEHIFIVDADYVLIPQALQRAVTHCSEDIGIIQFPQAYRNVGLRNIGMALDFKHFFSVYMNMANHLGCVPSTGTLTLIRVTALNAVGGFNANVITEDADFGLRINLAGYRSIYVSEIIGQGLMPHDLKDLKKQRWRWAFGNAQILKNCWAQLISTPRLEARQKIGYFIHLTAWFNFNLIPSLSLVFLSPLAWFGILDPIHPYLIVWSGFTLVSYIPLRFGTFYYSLSKEGHGLRDISLAFMTHFGLGWISSSSWLKCLVDSKSEFVRTNKFVLKEIPGMISTTIVETTLGTALILSAGIFTIKGFIIAPVGALVMAIGRFLVYWVGYQTRETRILNIKLHNKLDA